MPTDSADTAPMQYTFVSASFLPILISKPIRNAPNFATALQPVATERRAGVLLREGLIAFALLLTFNAQVTSA